MGFPIGESENPGKIYPLQIRPPPFIYSCPSWPLTECPFRPHIGAPGRNQ